MPDGTVTLTGGIRSVPCGRLGPLLSLFAVPRFPTLALLLALSLRLFVGPTASRTPWPSAVSLLPSCPTLVLPGYEVVITLRRIGTLPDSLVPLRLCPLTTVGTCLSVPTKPTMVSPGLPVTQLPPQAHPTLLSFLITNPPRKVRTLFL